MLEPTELTEIEALEAILDQISRSITELEDGPAQILEQAKGTTSEAIEELQKILRREVDDTAESIESISQAVSTLQSFIDGQIVKLGSERYIVPINSIVRSLRPNAEQISSVQGQLVLLTRAVCHAALNKLRFHSYKSF